MQQQITRKTPRQMLLEKRQQIEDAQRQKNMEQLSRQFGYMQRKPENRVEPPKWDETDIISDKVAWEATDDELWENKEQWLRTGLIAPPPPGVNVEEHIQQNTTTLNTKAEFKNKAEDAMSNPQIQEALQKADQYNKKLGDIFKQEAENGSLEEPAPEEIQAPYEESIQQIQPQPQQRVQQQRPKSVVMTENTASTGAAQPKPAKAEHRLLQTMNKNFQIDKDRYADVEVGDLFWKMQYIGGSLLSYAFRVADSLSVTPSERAFVAQIAFPAVSIVGLKEKNDAEFTPIWQIFGCPLGDAKIEDPFDPPFSVRIAQATELAQWLYKPKTNNILPQKLFLAYEHEFGKTNELVKSYLDDRMYFKCTERGCTETVYNFPRFDDKGELLPYYCPVHGIPMVVDEKVGLE